MGRSTVGGELAAVEPESVEGEARRDDEPLLSLQEAAAVVGVHYLTLYRKVRAGEVPALLAGGRYRIRRADLDRWLLERPARRGATATAPARRDWSRHAERFTALLIDGRVDEARFSVDRLVANGADPVEVCERVMAPALVAVGVAWERGEISVADEHRASAIVEAAIAMIWPALATPGPRRGIAVTTTAAGNRHTLPALMVAGALRADRFVVHFLGGDLPVEDVVALALREQADVVAISTTPDVTFEQVEAIVRPLVSAGLATIVGGPGIDAEGARALGALGYGTTLRDAQRLAQRAVGAAEPTTRRARSRRRRGEPDVGADDSERPDQEGA